MSRLKYEHAKHGQIDNIQHLMVKAPWLDDTFWNRN